MRDRHYYLIGLQYLGFRFHGWQKQPDVPTVERMVQRTLRFVLDHPDFKILAAGRTDARVSVNETVIELFHDRGDIGDLELFLKDLNLNLPSDIRALWVKPTTGDFNVIQHPKTKTYIYLFSHGEKFHPFCAPMMVYMKETLDIELMTKAAKRFEGTQDLWSYCYKPKENTDTVVTIDSCEIVVNDLLTANFFPAESFCFRVSATGFKRHMVRLMMGTLFDLGRGKMDWDTFLQSLDGSNKMHLSHIAPASGLMLWGTELSNL